MQHKASFLASMAAFFPSSGEHLEICGGELDFSSSCTQTTVIDAVNLVFLLIFYLLLVSSYVSGKHNNSHTKRSWETMLVSICCTVISAAYFGTCLLHPIVQKEDKPANWVVYVTKGLIWISLGASSLAQGAKSVRTFSSLWWISSFLLTSALNINKLVTKQEMEVLDILAWPVNLFLLLCAFKNLIQAYAHHIHDKTLVETLLSENTEKETPGKLQKLGFFSRLTFSWINPLLGLGYRKPLALDDIPCLFPEDEGSLQYQRFIDAWDSETSKKKHLKGKGNLVIRALAKVYLKEMVCVGLGAFIKSLTVIASPLLLYAFIDYSNSEQENLDKGLFLLGGLIMVKLVESLSQRHWFFQARRTGMRMRSALMVAVYQKQLKLSSLGRRRHSAGEIVNYIAVDTYRMGEFPWWFHYGWTLIVQLFLSIGVLFGVMGIGTLPGLIPLLIFCFLNAPYARLLQKHQSEFMKAQDERLRATSEILNNMKVIKLQSWEEKFKDVIEACRAEECKHPAGSLHTRAAGTPVFWMCPTVISSAIFLGCILLGSAPLDAVTIFTVLAMLRSMCEPVRMIPEAISALIQVLVSFDRIEAFLLDDELKTEEIRKLRSDDADSCVLIEHGNFSWDQESSTITLRNVNLEVRKGQKVAVCGPVGAGKSSLLYSILKEIPKVSGNVDIYGSIAYVSQTSWIQGGTIRDNILYWKPMDQARYEKAIKASALDKDINNFVHGDLTEIGQRGINMSGGQKQRIQLARAVYNDADVYLLDDPFSAVDAHTAAALFNGCVMAALRDKTVILVTHQVEFLSGVDKILVMEDGQIKHCGSYDELLMAGTAFNQLVNAHKDAATLIDPPSSEIMGEPHMEEIDQPVEDNCSSGFAANGENATKKGLPAVQLTEEEEKGIGDVGWKPFLEYILVSKGITSLCLATLSQCAFVLLQTASTYWLAFAIQIPSISSASMIGIYAGISALGTFFAYLRSFFSVLLGLRASNAFFFGFNNSIFKAPMLFFDSTPVGRIFTRASSDLSILDNDISFSIILVLTPVIELVGIIAVMAFVTWQVLIVFIITMVASNYVQRYYLASAREIVRINGTTKAPVMNYAAETSHGVTTIRAFNMADRFFHSYLKFVDTDAKLFFYTNASTEWLTLRVEALQNITLFAATFFLLLLPKGFIASEYVGLSLSYALVLTGTQVFMTRWYCNLSNYIISVERIKQFMHIQPEPSAIIDENRPPPTWPSKGRITLQDLKIRYRPNAPLVLKGITCTLHEGTRVGVVGRTGSGKTTLISALFRLVEPESGRIVLDGLDICSIGLKDLRTKLSVIPQEPTMFRGSVRTNLDPLHLYSDHEIWEALDKCQLKATISNLPNQLDSSVSDEGENWSAGQRQLFCLGRVLLKRNKILVLDEATASIDSETDAILQKIIREEFSNCTVITVAHRVPTVIDSSMVMVLSFGRLVEYDDPTTLMQTNSSFSKLVKEYWSSCRRSSSKNINHLTQ